VAATRRSLAVSLSLFSLTSVLIAVVRDRLSQIKKVPETFNSPCHKIYLDNLDEK